MSTENSVANTNDAQSELSDIMFTSKNLGQAPIQNKTHEEAAKALSKRLGNGDSDEINTLINGRSFESSSQYLSGVKLSELDGEVSQQMVKLANIHKQFNSDGTLKPERTGLKGYVYRMVGRTVVSASDMVGRGKTMQDEIVSIQNTLSKVSQRNKEQADIIDNMIGEYAEEISNVSIAIRALCLAIEENNKNIKRIDDHIKTLEHGDDDIQAISDRKTLLDINERYEVRVENLRRDRVARFANYIQIMESRKFFLAQADHLDSINRSNIPTLSRAIQQSHLLYNLSQSAALGKKTQDATNESMKAASNMTMKAVEDVAQGLGRPSIELDTLKNMISNYKETQTKLAKIATDSRNERLTGNKQIANLESEVKSILTEHGRKQRSIEGSGVSNPRVSYETLDGKTEGHAVNMDRYGAQSN